VHSLSLPSLFRHDLISDIVSDPLRQSECPVK
jgi:hypothetical protein